MKVQVITIVFLLLLPAILIAQEVKGIITDYTTNTPIANANVVIAGTKMGTISDQEGRFVFHLSAKPEPVTIIVSHIGYMNYTHTFTIKRDEANEITIRLIPSATTFNEIIITATRTQRNIQDIPASVRVFASEQIKDYPFTAIDDLLRTDASIVVDRKNGIFSKNASINMRGLNSSARTLVMIDGVPLNKADGGGVNWNRINPESIDRIEVVKGPGSALYGGNAMGGVINIISKDIPEKFSGSIKGSVGSCNTQGAQAWLSGRINAIPRLGWNISTFYRRGDGYIIAPSENRDTTDIKAYLWEYNIGGKLDYTLKHNGKIEIGHNYYDDKRGDGVRVYDPEGGYNKYRTNHTYANFKSTFGNTSLVANAYVQLENFMNQKEQIKTEKLPPYAITQYVLYLVDAHRKDAGMWVSATTKARNKHAITYGSDIRLSSSNTSDIYFTATDTITNKAKLNSFAVFVQDEFSMLNNRIKIVAGARADAVFFENASFSIASPSVVNNYLMVYTGGYKNKHWLAVSPKIGAQYSLNTTTKIYLNYATGFRPGTLDDMCRSGSISKGFKMANPDLKPEYIHNYEIGSTISIGQFLQVESSLYYSTGNQFHYFVGTGDTIYSASNPKAILKRENVSKAAISGFEATFRITPVKSLMFSFSYAYNHSVIKSFDTIRFVAKDLSGKFLMEVPKNRFTALLTWKNKYFNSMLMCDYTGSLFTDDENLIELPSYFKLDAKISRVFAEKYSLSLTVQNLTNNIYTDNKGNLGMSRFIMLEAGYRF